MRTTRKPKIRWAEWLGREECPYARRWMLDLGFTSIRVHHFYRSDDPRYLHDHPWWFISLVLKGGYWDVGACPWCEGTGSWPAPLRQLCPQCQGTLRVRTRRERFSVAFRPAEYAHYVDPFPGGVWSVILTGKYARPWGFWVNGKFKKAHRFFFDYGHPPCEVAD